MINRDYRPRLDFGTIQTNVIMTQIRAEKQKTSIKIVEPLLTPSTKERIGKRHFQRDLYKMTDITNTYRNDDQRSPSKSTGKRILNKSQSMTQIETSKSPGKKKFDEKFKRTTLIPVENKCKRPQPQKTSFGRRRLDYSPVNQQRQSNYSPLKWNQNFF